MERERRRVLFLFPSSAVVVDAPPPPHTHTHSPAVFFAFLSPRIPPYQTALVAVTLAVSLAMLAATALSDPGFVPRDPPPPTAWSTPRPPPRVVDVNGVPVATKWCATCAHHRPPRTSHCAVCDNCVWRFDHHCPWVGQCVGERNYRFFLTFVYATATLCVLVQVLCWVRLGRQAHQLGNISLAVARDPAALALAFYCLASLAFVGGLAGFHTVLVSRATTTYEHFRGWGGVAAGGGGGSNRNPYDLGCGTNWASVCCTPVAPILPETRPLADAAVAAGLAPAPAWPPAAWGAFDRGALRAAAAAPSATAPPGDIELPPPAVSYGYGPTAAEAALAATQAARAAAAEAAAGEKEAGGDVEAPPLPPSPPAPAPAAGSPVPSSPLFAARAMTAARSLRSALSSAAEEAGGGGGGDIAAAAAAPPSPAPSTTPTMVTAPGSLATMSMFSAEAGEGPPSVTRASPPPLPRSGSTSPPRSQSPRRRPPWRPGGGTWAGPTAHALALSPAHEARLSPPPPRRR